MNEKSYRMWKLAMPVIIAAGTGAMTWTLGTVEEIEQDMAGLQQQVTNAVTQREIDQVHTKQFLETLKQMGEGIQKNSEGIIALEAQVHSVVERNNKMIELLIEEVRSQ